MLIGEASAFVTVVYWYFGAMAVSTKSELDIAWAVSMAQMLRDKSRSSSGDFLDKATQLLVDSILEDPTITKWGEAIARWRMHRGLPVSTSNKHVQRARQLLMRAFNSIDEETLSSKKRCKSTIESRPRIIKCQTSRVVW